MVHARTVFTWSNPSEGTPSFETGTGLLDATLMRSVPRYFSRPARTTFLLLLQTTFTTLARIGRTLRSRKPNSVRDLLNVLPVCHKWVTLTVCGALHVTRTIRFKLGYFLNSCDVFLYRF